MQSKTTMQLLILSLVLALIAIFGPLIIFHGFLLQAQFLITFIMLFALLSFYAYTQAHISNTLNRLSKINTSDLLPELPDLLAGASLKQLFSFGDELIHFIKIRVLSQEKLMDDYRQIRDELDAHILINKKFLKFAQHAVVSDTEENIHSVIQQEILGLTGGLNASAFYMADSCSDFLRLDSTYGFEDDSFLLKSVPSADFTSPIFEDESSIRIIEKTPYAKISYFISNIERSNELFDFLEMPIYIDHHLYGIFLFFNTLPEETFSNELRLLLKNYTSQAINAVTSKILMRKTFYLSKYDSLTGLYNRSYFEQYFEDYNKHALRYKEHYAIVLIDLNRLKTINDKFGHVAGDRALQEFANLFNSKIRETDILARFGGDEFIAIFHNSTLDQTQARLKLIHEEFTNYHIRYGGFNIPLRFSYGVSASPDESMILNILVKLANERMYELKEHLHEIEKEDFNF
ncbi:MAG: GGDEF domain-containing protein [Clostridia bacterium]|nr:GGDEF domain-containing protein [Clostridia bacterium]